jgi:hypothetical protein
MSSATLPKRPVENWEQVRGDWVAEVERFMNQAEEWAKKQGWGTLQELKTIQEDRLGSYDVPRLLIHDTFGRLLLDPLARFVMGADGRIDLVVIPSWSGLILVKMPDGWFLLEDDADGPRFAWSEDVFVRTAKQLATSA